MGDPIENDELRFVPELNRDELIAKLMDVFKEVDRHEPVIR